MNTPNFRSKRPAPRTAGGWGKPVTDTVTWTRTVDPRERYRIVYVDRDGERSERTIELSKVGNSEGTAYLGVTDQGRFKTMRADRVIAVLEQLTTGHEPSIRAFPSYVDTLPAFPLDNAVYKVPMTADPRKSWTVDLNLYTCTCPEKRVRAGMGYAPGQLGHVCLHIARALQDHLPPDAPGWTPELLQFLNDRRRLHIDNLTAARPPV